MKMLQNVQRKLVGAHLGVADLCKAKNNQRNSRTDSIVAIYVQLKNTKLTSYCIDHSTNVINPLAQIK